MIYRFNPVQSLQGSQSHARRPCTHSAGRRAATTIDILSFDSATHRAHGGKKGALRKSSHPRSLIKAQHYLHPLARCLCIARQPQTTRYAATRRWAHRKPASITVCERDACMHTDRLHARSHACAPTPQLRLRPSSGEDSLHTAGDGQRRRVAYLCHSPQVIAQRLLSRKRCTAGRWGGMASR